MAQTDATAPRHAASQAGQPLDYDALLSFAGSLAREAGAVMREYFRSVEKQAAVKADASQVTVADRLINQLVIERVAAAYPGHGVRGEEASAAEDSRLLWVCDPIDGTNGFISGEPTSVFSLALADDGEPVLAVVYDPLQDRLYRAVKGGGAFCGAVRLRVSGKGVKDALVAGPGSFNEIERTFSLFQILRDHGARVRMFGGIVFKGCLLAEGRIEGLVFPGQGAHDIAAIKLIVEEAGGRVTDLLGQEQRYDRPIRGAVVSNGIIHDQLLQAVQDFGFEEFLGY